MSSKATHVFSTQIGSEYILEIIGTESEFKDKKLYFHCLICKKYDFPDKIEEHKISNAHRIKFLVSFKGKLDDCIVIIINI